MAIANNQSILALDVGGSRIGVAVASQIARIAHPLGAIVNDTSFTGQLTKLIAEHEVAEIVVGYPRNMSGEATEQTKVVEAFVATLQQNIQLPVTFQDESITSRQAESELISRGKHYEKADIDALAAVYILEDYLKSRA